MGWFSKDYVVWYNNGTGYYDCAGVYSGRNEQEAKEKAQKDGLQWCNDIVVTWSFDDNPNKGVF